MFVLSDKMFVRLDCCSVRSRIVRGPHCRGISDRLWIKAQAAVFMLPVGETMYVSDRSVEHWKLLLCFGKSLNLFVWWGFYGVRSSYFTGNQLVKSFSLTFISYVVVLCSVVSLTWGNRKHGQSPNRRLDDRKAFCLPVPLKAEIPPKFLKVFEIFSPPPLRTLE